MKIRPDYEGRNDEWTGGPDDKLTVRYYEKVYEDGYFYELYVMIDGVKSAIIITEGGVSIEWRSGPNCDATIHTNIVPKQLFEGLERLTWPHLLKIIKIVESTGGEGLSYSREEMKELYERWKQLGKP